MESDLGDRAGQGGDGDLPLEKGVQKVLNVTGSSLGGLTHSQPFTALILSLVFRSGLTPASWIPRSLAQAHFCCGFPRAGRMAVVEAWDHQQVTLGCPGTQHPLFRPIPTPSVPGSGLD